jgi:hypothetical protein
MSNVLATPEQLELERLALRVFEAPALRQARERARALLLADPIARTPDGASGLERALDQWVMGQVAATINRDPSRPHLLWAVDNTPRAWFGHIFPGAAVAIDNPDNVNRVAPLHGDFEYLLEGRFGRPATAQTSISVTRADNGQLRWGDAVATLTDQMIETDDQGRFSITLDQRPADGRANHMQIVAGPLQMAIRDSHSDWAQQATEFSLRVTSGPAQAAPASEDALVREAAEGLEAFVTFWLGFKNSFWDRPEHNRMVGPLGRAREGGWGTQAGGRFLLEPEQALVITTRSGGARYTGIQVSDPWTISPTPVYLTTSRNLAQSHPNPDGSYTYVIAMVDPGTANWIDTAGIREGWFMLRWQNLPEGVACEGLVEDTRLVPLEDLDSALPAGCPLADLSQRRLEILTRIGQHERRCGEG